MKSQGEGEGGGREHARHARHDGNNNNNAKRQAILTRDSKLDNSGQVNKSNEAAAATAAAACLAGKRVGKARTR